MKAVLMSIQPKWCELIANSEKTVEVRKTKPKLETPFKVYIYCTQGKDVLAISRYDDKSAFLWEKSDVDRYNADMVRNGKVIGEFVCDGIIGGYFVSPFSDFLQKKTCLSYDELESYGNDKPLFAWHISDLVIYDKPKELREFSTVDNEAVKRCEHRERIYNNPDFVNGAMLPGSYLCKDKTNWCTKCKTKPITRPPQSWCYVEELEDEASENNGKS